MKKVQGTQQRPTEKVQPPNRFTLTSPGQAADGQVPGMLGGEVEEQKVNQRQLTPIIAQHTGAAAQI